MASASQGERAVAGLEDGESAVPMSVEGELAVPIAGDGKRAVVGSAEGGGTLLRSLEYPCTARLRRRRLLAYLRGHSCDEIYEAYAPFENRPWFCLILSTPRSPSFL